MDYAFAMRELRAVQRTIAENYLTLWSGDPLVNIQEVDAEELQAEYESMDSMHFADPMGPTLAMGPFLTATNDPTYDENGFSNSTFQNVPLKEKRQDREKLFTFIRGFAASISQNRIDR